MGKILTRVYCSYCGMAYPEGTPPHGAQILTDHIKVCEKHPMRKAEETISILRDALEGLIGVSSKTDLESMELVLRTSDTPSADKSVSINAIHALLKTLEE